MCQEPVPADSKISAACQIILQLLSSVFPRHCCCSTHVTSLCGHSIFSVLTSCFYSIFSVKLFHCRFGLIWLIPPVVSLFRSVLPSVLHSRQAKKLYVKSTFSCIPYPIKNVVEKSLKTHCTCFCNPSVSVCGELGGEGGILFWWARPTVWMQFRGGIITPHGSFYAFTTRWPLYPPPQPPPTQLAQEL
jgi:hypothetical protein